jgi:hypothetical protein
MFKIKLNVLLDSLRDLQGNRKQLSERGKSLQDELREERIALEKCEITKLELRKEVDDLTALKEAVRVTWSALAVCCKRPCIYCAPSRRQKH